jgi:hypothetical protein
MASTQEIRARVRGRVWQAFAQAGVSAAPLSAERLEALVDEITDGVLLEVDDALEPPAPADQPAANAAPAAEGAIGDEEVLWEGRPFLSLTERYTVTTERLRVERGLLGRDREDLELVRIQDIDHTQTLGERMVRLGDVHVRGHDASHPEITLRNVKDPEGVHELIRRAVLDARKRSNFAFREEM